MTRKKKVLLNLFAINLLFIAFFFFGMNSFLGIQSQPGYTYGTIIENWKVGRYHHYYSRYQYQVDGITYCDRQSGELPINSLFVVVYDKKNPKNSMIADYPYTLIAQNGDVLPIDKKYVEYDWWDYIWDK